MSEDPQSPQARFILREWCPAFERRDLDFIEKHMHKDFRCTSYPQSLGQPEQTKEQWVKHFTGIFNLLTENKVSHIHGYSNPFAAVKLLPQTTTHFVIDTPGKVITHVRILVDQTDPAPT